MAVNNSHEMTREGYDNLNAELEQLITVTRKENAERLKEAIALGDISENAEYDAAKNAQAETEERISEIEEILRTAVIVDETEEGDDSVQTGRTVTVRDLVLGITATYHFSEVLLSSFCDHRHHVHPSFVVVVVYTPTLHRRILLSSEGSLGFILFLVHECKNLSRDS